MAAVSRRRGSRDRYVSHANKVSLFFGDELAIAIAVKRARARRGQR